MKGQTLLDCECWRQLGCDPVICKDSLDLEAVFGEKLGFGCFLSFFFFYFFFLINITPSDSVVLLCPVCAFCVCMNSPTAFCIIKSLVSDEAIWVGEAESASPTLFPRGITGVGGNRIGGISGTG